MKAPMKEIDSEIVLDNEVSNRFYHRVLASKAKEKKRAMRKRQKASTHRNRRK
jgi:hypothetical protein